MIFKKTIACIVLVLFTTASYSELFKNNDICACITPISHQETIHFFNCLNPLKSQHLASKYQLFKLMIKNRSEYNYLISADQTKKLIPPERIAQRIKIARAWIPFALALTSCCILSSLFYIAMVPAVALSFTLGICATTVNPKKVTENNQLKMLHTIFDGNHDSQISAYSNFKKIIAIRKSKKKKQNLLFLCKNQSTEQCLEIKIPCL